MNVNEIVRRVTRKFGDESEALIVIQDIFDWINDGQVEIIRKTECNQGLTTFNHVFGSNPEGKFTLPTDFIIESRVAWKDVPLVRTEIQDFDSMRVQTTGNSSSAPTAFYIWGNEIFIWPIPTEDGNHLKLWYQKMPIKVEGSLDALTIPIKFHEDLVSYCLMHAHNMNENYQAEGIFSERLESRLAQSANEAQNPHDSFPVIRDDPADWW